MCQLPVFVMQLFVIEKYRQLESYLFFYEYYIPQVSKAIRCSLKTCAMCFNFAFILAFKEMPVLDMSKYDVQVLENECKLWVFTKTKICSHSLSVS